MAPRRSAVARIAVAVASAALVTACVEESTLGERPATGYRDGTRVQSPAGDTHGGASWGGKGRSGEHKLYMRMK
jgi:hypothetical protein